MIYTPFLYLCGCFLFWEWLYPLHDMTDTESIRVFIFYAYFCFLITFLQIKWWLSFPVKGIVLLFLIHWLYFDQSSLFSLTWIAQLIQEFSFNVDALISQNYDTLTSTFRSFLFFDFNRFNELFTSLLVCPNEANLSVCFINLHLYYRT